ncbi:MAG: MFS transporter, partial [Rubrimonas sp.]
MTPTRRTACVIMLGLAQTLGWGTTYYLPAILAGPMAAELGVGVGAVFAAFSGALIVSAALGPMAGRMIDRSGGRGALTLSSLVFAAGLATLGLAQGYPMLLAGWLLLGAGMSFGLYEAAFATLVAALGREARGPITGVTLIAGFASTVCWPLTALMDAELGWRGACLVWARAHLLIGLPLNLT